MRTRWIVAGAGAAAAALGGALWQRTHPTACPYGQRWMIEIPRPVLTRSRLLQVLGAQTGEQVLELGPGTGYFTLDVAAAVAPGRLAIFDVQQEMLDHVMRAADQRGLKNIEPTQGDARKLPYDDGTFDAAFLVTVLGEIPDQDAALAELARVLKPGGRVVFGEIAADPHFVSLATLEQRSAPHGLRLEGRRGFALSYYARLVKDASG